MVYDLYDAAQRLLQNLVEQLEIQGVIVPDLVYIAPGNEVAWDCEQLTLNLNRVLGNYEGADTPFPTQHALLMNSAEFIATIIRCIPVRDEGGGMPSAQEMSDAAGVLIRDARAIRRSFEIIDQHHLVVPRNVPLTVGPVNTVGPMGGYAGVSGGISFQTVDEAWALDGGTAMPARQSRHPKHFDVTKDRSTIEPA